MRALRWSTGISDHVRTRTFSSPGMLPPALTRRWPIPGCMPCLAGPVLAANLRKLLAGEPPRRSCQPRWNSLYLMNTGDGSAIASYGRLAAQGAFVLRLKPLDRQALDCPIRRACGNGVTASALRAKAEQGGPLKKLIILAALAAIVAAYFLFDLGQYLTLEGIKQAVGQWEAFYAENPVAVLAGFFAIYVAVTAASLPGAAIMTLAAGALFGLVTGTILVSFASTLGATLAFLSARYVLRDTIEARFGERLKAINAGLKRDGAFYLFSLRMIPAFPFFVVNLVMGLTRIRIWTYVWVSQVGMLLGTAVYVNAGTQLARIDSLSGIVSPECCVSFALAWHRASGWPVCVSASSSAAGSMPGSRVAASASFLSLVPALVASSVAAGRGADGGQSGSAGSAQDGRRLPQLRVCSVQGAD